ncbi:MAG: type II CAAX endopeptidase family protein [Bryobacteraceae bacterium]
MTSQAPESASRISPAAIAARVGVFAILGYLGLQIFSLVLYPVFGLLIASVIGVFAAAAVANSLALRIYEHLRLPAVGLDWNNDSPRHFAIGMGVGVGAALLVLGVPLLFGLAQWTADSTSATGVASFLFVTMVLLFGAFGEELLFRGYAFQLLVGRLGTAATLLPMSVLFAAAHSSNAGVSLLGLFNTFAWGAVLGWSLLRSGDLWLPIGLHFGWNWTMPLMGVNLSGFTMRVTGVALDWKISDRWSGGDYGPEGGMLCTLVLIPVVVALWKAPIRTQHLALVIKDEEDA